MHIHGKGVSHGDLYAHNTMVDDKASVLLGDFGAASNLLSLPILQQEAMERIEVRAFACMLDDMLALSSKEHNTELDKELTELKDSCIQNNVALRPGFSEIKERLQTLIRFFYADDKCVQ